MVNKFTDELLDIVDTNDCVVRQEWRSLVRAQQIQYIRGVAGFLKNSSGQLWIARRCAHKQILPLALDMSVSGHVGAGETYEQAFVRELYEELALKASDVQYRFLGKLIPGIDPTNYFVGVFEIPYEKDPDYNKKDFCEAFWLYPEEILNKIARGEQSKSGLPVMLKKFYGAV